MPPPAGGRACRAAAPRREGPRRRRVHGRGGRRGGPGAGAARLRVRRGAAGRLAYESAALAASLDAPELAGPLAALYSEGGGSYTLLRAPESALWFGFADGFEGLTARYLASLTARELGGLLDAGEAKAREASGEEEREGAARLVLSERWYFAALCPEGAPLSPGGEARLDFGGFSVRAAVEAVGEAQDGEKPVLFSCGERVAFTAQLRFAAARLAAADDPR